MKYLISFFKTFLQKDYSQMNLMSSTVTVFLPACAAALMTFLANSSAEASTASAKAFLASSLILSAPASFKIRTTGATGISLTFSPPYS